MSSKSEFNISITGSTVGAMAVGGDARAESHIGPAAKAGGKLDIELMVTCATRDQIAVQLELAARKVREGNSVYASSDAETGVKTSYSITRSVR